MWPAEAAGPADPAHLSGDAEFAEDLAIRYADVHHGLRTPGYVSGEVYTAERDRCMQSLYEQIAKTHNVPTRMVSRALGHNRAGTDAAINLPFILIYCLAAAAMGRVIWRRYPPAEHGWVAGVIMVLFLSVVFALGGTMLGETCSWIAETERMGNSHMSYRVERLWWVQHRSALFAGGLVVFWLAAAAGSRRSLRQ